MCVHCVAVRALLHTNLCNIFSCGFTSRLAVTFLQAAASCSQILSKSMLLCKNLIVAVPPAVALRRVLEPLARQPASSLQRMAHTRQIRTSRDPVSKCVKLKQCPGHPMFFHSSSWMYAAHRHVLSRAHNLSRRFSSGPEARMHLGGRSAVASLIATNVLVYFMWQRVDPRFMMQHFTLSADNLRRHGRWHTLITHVFSHRTLDHLIMNMLGLFFFAPAMTAALGAPAFLGAYAGMGVMSGLATLWGNAFAQRVGPPSMWAQRNTVSLGASGAVYGVLAYGVCANPTATIYLNFFIPVPAWLFGAGIVGYSAYRSVAADPLDHIGHTAHLSGAIMGGLLFLATRGRVRRH